MRAISWPHHRECLARTSLSIRKTSSLSSLKCLHDKRPHTLLIDRLVVLVTLKDIIELKIVLLNELCQVHLRLHLADGQTPTVEDLDHVLSLALLAIQRSLSHDDSDLGRLCYSLQQLHFKLIRLRC